jgi:arsenate reductase
MAEAFLNTLGGGRFYAESAGIEAGKLNPRVVRVMKEAGIDISNNATKRVVDSLSSGKAYDLVVTVCDAVNAAMCPVVPGAKMEAWYFDDPSTFSGTDEEISGRIRIVRDQIKAKVEEFIRTH